MKGECWAKLEGGLREEARGANSREGGVRREEEEGVRREEEGGVRKVLEVGAVKLLPCGVDIIGILLRGLFCCFGGDRLARDILGTIDNLGSVGLEVAEVAEVLI